VVDTEREMARRGRGGGASVMLSCVIACLFGKMTGADLDPTDPSPQ
jgi:hypothetical protein